MKVGPTLLHQLQRRYIEMTEAVLRTEALLLGEEHYEATPALSRLIHDAKPRKKHDGFIDPMLDAARYAMMYGSATMRMPRGAAISGASPVQAIVDEISFQDIERLTEQLRANYTTSARRQRQSMMFAGIHDAIVAAPVEEATPPRASMAWPASHQGKKGPAPHKPFRKR